MVRHSTGMFAAVGLCLLSLPQTGGHSWYMLDEDHCDLPLVIGTKIMGRRATESSVKITLSRGKDQLSDGEFYVPGEVLEVSVPPRSGEVCFEATGGAKFSGGGCGKTRLAKNGASLTMPASGGAVSIVAAHASHYGTVSITSPLTLKSGKRQLSSMQDVRGDMEADTQGAATTDSQLNVASFYRMADGWALWALPLLMIPIALVLVRATSAITQKFRRCPTQEVAEDGEQAPAWLSAPVDL